MIKTGALGKLLESLMSEWDMCLFHMNIKQIQMAQFQADLENPNVHILRIAFAMSYPCGTEFLVKMPECYAFQMFFPTNYCVKHI